MTDSEVKGDDDGNDDGGGEEDDDGDDDFDSLATDLKRRISKHQYDYITLKKFGGLGMPVIRDYIVDYIKRT